MKNIRSNVFETNSSSCHSISISSDSDGILDTMRPDTEGTIRLEGGEFGWIQDTHNDPWTKANFCAVDVMKDDDKQKMLRKVICEHTGAKEVIFDMSDDYQKDNYSYIDHESCGISYEAFKDEGTLKQFIFNPKSVLVLDYDG